MVTQYTWGLDVAQSLGAAGGIGGLLACRDPNDPADANDPYGDFAYFYDAGGNVTQLVGVSASAGYGQLAARYEYDPYGNLLLDVGSDSASGGYAPFNALRFSTKPFDEETTFGNWGRRYFGPTLGRWGSRDPIGEHGGLNLFAYVKNAVTSVVDRIGLCGDDFLKRWEAQRPGILQDPPVRCTDCHNPGFLGDPPCTREEAVWGAQVGLASCETAIGGLTAATWIGALIALHGADQLAALYCNEPSIASQVAGGTTDLACDMFGVDPTLRGDIRWWTELGADVGPGLASLVTSLPRALNKCKELAQRELLSNVVDGRVIRRRTSRLFLR